MLYEHWWSHGSSGHHACMRVGAQAGRGRDASAAPRLLTFTADVGQSEHYLQPPDEDRSRQRVNHSVRRPRRGRPAQKLRLHAHALITRCACRIHTDAEHTHDCKDGRRFDCRDVDSLMKGSSSIDLNNSSVTPYFIDGEFREPALKPALKPPLSGDSGIADDRQSDSVAMSTAQKPRGCCSARFTSVIAAAGLLAIGLLITGLVTAGARDVRARSMLAQHLELTVTSSKYMISVYISFVSAAFSARQVVQEQYALWSSNVGNVSSTATTAPLSSILRALAGTFPHTNLTFAATAVIPESERPDFESWLNRTCGEPLGASNMSIGSVMIRAPRAQVPRFPTRASGLYSIVVDTIVLGAPNSVPACSITGLEFSNSDFRTQRFLEAVDSGRLIWQVPTPALGAPVGQLNIGLVMPVLAPTAASAGPVGAAHARYMSSRPDSTSLIPWTCARNGSEHSDVPCGQAGRALGTVTIPMYATTPLSTLVDNVPNVKGSQLTLLYIPPEFKPLLRLDGSDVWSGEPVRLSSSEGTPLPDKAYTEETYMQRTSWLLERGSLGPLLAAIPASSVLLSALHEPERAGKILNGGAPGQAFGPWVALADADDVRGSIADADRDVAKLQAARVFLLGSSAYVFILRDRAGVDTSDFIASQALAWTVGILLSLLLATLLPGLLYAFSLQQERQHAVQMALLQSEKDGVVQAVAFAAHEIRNPMHGVLASLETALADLQPLVVELKRSKTTPSTRRSTESEAPEPVLLSELKRLLGPQGCDTALLALEDIAVAKYSAENCHRLVNDMVEYSKLQRGVMSIQKGDMEVRPALRALVDSQRSFLHPSVRTFVGAHADVPPVFHTDQVRVSQILANGLTNASKFTIAGEVYLSCLMLDTSSIPALSLPHNPGNKWVAFLVADTGKGLAGIDVDSLFEPIKVSAAVDKQSRPFRVLQQRVRAWLGSGRAAERGQKPLPASSAAKNAHDHAINVSGGPASPRSKLAGEAASKSTSRESKKGGGNSQAVTASSVAKLRGSGLGLPVARLMARALGGDVDLYTESESGLGTSLTVFMFLLPLSAMEPSPSTEQGLAAALPKQHPLFGRAGSLNAAVRQELRSLVCRRMNSLLPNAQTAQQFEELSAHSGSDTHHAPGAGSHSKSSQSGSSDKRSGTGTGTGSQGTASTRNGALAVPTVDIPSSLPLPGDLQGFRDSHGAPVSSVFEETMPRRRVGFTAGQTVSTDSRSSMELAGAPAPVTANVDPLRIAARIHARTVAPSAGQGQYSRTDTETSATAVQPESATGAAAVADSSSVLICVARGNLSRTVDRDRDRGLPRGADSGQGAEMDGLGASGPRDLSDSTVWPPTSHIPPSLAVQVEKPAGTPLQLLYAEDDGTNRRLMERMLGRLGTGQHKALATGSTPTSAADASSQSAGSPHSTTVTLKTDITTVGDGWEALCTLHRHGHIDAVTLGRAQTAAASAEGELTLPYVADLHGDNEVPVMPFDVIFLDVDMPRATGDQVASYLRQSQLLSGGRAPLVPIIAVTGRAVELQLKSSLCARLGCTALPEGAGVRVMDTLPDPVLDAVFDGALGKPFKSAHLQALMELLQRREG